MAVAHLLESYALAVPGCAVRAFVRGAADCSFAKSAKAPALLRKMETLVTHAEGKIHLAVTRDRCGCKCVPDQNPGQQT